MAYDKDTDTGAVGRPAGEDYLQFPYDSGESRGIRIYWGTGSPESAVTGIVGDLFIRTDGGADTVLYVKESGTGNTGWVAK